MLTLNSKTNGHETDWYGVEWGFPKDELCPVCGQPDSCGDCNHQPLTERDVALLKEGEIEDCRCRFVTLWRFTI